MATTSSANFSTLLMALSKPSLIYLPHIIFTLLITPKSSFIKPLLMAKKMTEIHKVSFGVIASFVLASAIFLPAVQGHGHKVQHNWDLSCKRKALEGTSQQFCPGGSSSTSQPMKNKIQHSVPFRYTTPGSLSISSDPGNLTKASHSEQIHPRSGVGLNRVASGIHSSSSVPVIRESSGSFGVRSNLGHQSVSPEAARSS